LNSLNSNQNDVADEENQSRQNKKNILSPKKEDKKTKAKGKTQKEKEE
jgi:hypothetical protein